MGDSLQHESMALLSSDLDSSVVDDPTNMPSLVAFERTQAAPQSFCLNDVAPLNIQFISNIFTMCTQDREFFLVILLEATGCDMRSNVKENKTVSLLAPHYVS